MVSSTLPLESLRPLLPDNVALTSSADEVLQNKDIHLVAVATPIKFHFEITKKALETGKHVVVEKPLSVSLEEADELIKIARDKKLVFSQHHNRRWDN